MASPKTRRALAELRPKDENDVSYKENSRQIAVKMSKQTFFIFHGILQSVKNGSSGDS